LANLTCGFAAIAFGDLFIGSVLLLVAILLDTFDGYFARRLRAESEIGEQLDSLADMISFGVAPAYLYYQLAPNDNVLFIIAPILFVSGAALRLAKFNTLPKLNYFIGLPTPFATLFLIGLFIGIQYDKEFFSQALSNPFIYFSLPLCLMILMLSHIKMFSLKSLEGEDTSLTLPLLFLMIFGLLILFDFRVALPSIVLIYVFFSFAIRKSFQ